MTELNITTLTEQERSHVEHGGRVLIVDEVPGPLWRVLCVSNKGCSALLKPNDADGYDDPAWARELAQGVADLSEDTPMVRP